MNRLPLVYIAGPITKGDQMTNVAHAMRVWEALRVSGKVAPICPHWSALQQMFCPIGHADWLKFDTQVILRCDALLRINPFCFPQPVEIPPSSGADEEVALATKIGIPVFYRLYTNGNQPGVINWAKDVWPTLRRSA